MSNESLEIFKKDYMKQFGLRNEQEYLDRLALIERQVMLNDCSGLIQMDTSMRDNRPRLA